MRNFLEHLQYFEEHLQAAASENVHQTEKKYKVLIRDFNFTSEKSENVYLFVFISCLVFFRVCIYIQYFFDVVRSSRPEVLLRQGALKICSKFTGEHPCRSAISIKLICNFFEVTLRHGCSPVNLLHTFRTPFPKNISGRLLLCGEK